jgi:ribonuclease HII
LGKLYHKVLSLTNEQPFLTLLFMSYICGIDEAGRGPLAGPVCAAAVVLPPSFPIEVLADSKTLSPRKRSEIESLIKESAFVWALGWVNHKDIDVLNILEATMVAMRKAFDKAYHMFPNISSVVVDGNKAPQLSLHTEAVVRGDSLIAEIMAASILAKQGRDRLMVHLHNLYPEYGYASHKGYPTKAHIKACQEFGPSPIQRLTYSIR